nr:MAG TPA: hypothetical protein [Caudoviricetes sp.]
MLMSVLAACAKGLLRRTRSSPFALCSLSYVLLKSLETSRR